MIKKTTLTIFLLYLLAFSWDGQRKGFIGGIEIANGIILWQPTYLTGIFKTETNSNTNYLFNTNLKLGYSAESKFEFQYYLEFNFINQAQIEIGKIINNGFDISYYFLPISPSYFINLSCGLSSWSRPKNPDLLDFNVYGLNLSLGFGKEITKHFYVLIKGVYNNGSGATLKKTISISPSPNVGFGEVKDQSYGINLVLGITGY
jgi:hypothetical protein